MRPFLYLFLLFSLFSLSLAKKDLRRTEPHCGLPIFTENLPEAQKLKVISIWESYSEGDECEKERAETKQTLASLPPSVRAKALHPKGPAFLKGASAQVRREFEKLWKNSSIPRTEKPEKFRELAEMLLNPIQLREFNKFHAEMEKRRDEFQKKLAALSPEARAAHEELSELRERRHRVFMEASESVRDELNDLYRHEKEDTSHRQRRAWL